MFVDRDRLGWLVGPLDTPQSLGPIALAGFGCGLCNMNWTKSLIGIPRFLAGLSVADLYAATTPATERPSTRIAEGGITRPTGAIATEQRSWNSPALHPPLELCENDHRRFTKQDKAGNVNSGSPS